MLRSIGPSTSLGTGLALMLIVLLCALAAAAPTTLLPTGRQITAPAGPVAHVGTLPEGLALPRDGTRLLVLEGGFDPPALRVLDARTLAARGVIPLKGAYGVPLVDPDGDGAWIAGANTDAILHVDLAKLAVDRTIAIADHCWPSVVARLDVGRLAVACEFTGSLAFVDETSGVSGPLHHIDRAPAALVVSPNRSQIFVAAWGDHTVDVVDAVRGTLLRRIGVGMHPEALALAPDRRHLFVANTDDDSIAVVDIERLDRLPRVIPLHFDATGLFGDSLNAFALAPDGKRLYVTAGAANAVYVLAIDGRAGLQPLGAIPAGWYPTATLATSTHLYVADGYGESGHANPGLDPLARSPYYIAHQDTGSIRLLPLPTLAALRAGADQVRRLAGSSAPRADAVVRPHGPIRHVIYIIRENRTYDQVFGDVAGADGDPQLTLFGETITPNAHAIVRRFGVFDRTFTDAKVSADGHNWSTAAIANDYVEKMWPPLYGGRRKDYDFEDPASPSHPHAGYVWDAAVNAHVSLRNYGEFIYQDDPVAMAHLTRSLRANTDFAFAGFTFRVSDIAREAEWEREFRAFERSGTLPTLEIVRLPNDHTQGTKPEALTPQAYVAQNDEAVGKLVDAVSHSRFWSSTAIFAIEDDSQNGPDHVDSQRTAFLLASPYARGGVQHAMYTTASVLHTIEIILGIPPMTTYDARALPLYNAFTRKPDLRPFDAMAPKIDIQAKNQKSAYRARDAARLDFSHADAVPDETMNDMIWHAVRGAGATPPPFGRFAQ